MDHMHAKAGADLYLMRTLIEDAFYERHCCALLQAIRRAVQWPGRAGVGNDSILPLEADTTGSERR